MNDEILNQIIILIEKQMGRYKKPITRETCLEQDLGMTGDDAVEFLLDYGKKFSVDMTKLDIGKYFMPEGDTVFSLLVGKKELKEKELTVGDLEKGVKAKLLNEQVING